MTDYFDHWNLLHDGSILSINERRPGNISIKVEVDYIINKLAEALAPENKFLWIHLRDCRKLTYSPFKKPNSVTKIEALINCDLEILSAEYEKDHVSIFCTEGILCLSYGDVVCELGDRSAVTLSALSQAYQEYWQDWEQHRQRSD